MSHFKHHGLPEQESKHVALDFLHTDALYAVRNPSSTEACAKSEFVILLQ